MRAPGLALLVVLGLAAATLVAAWPGAEREQRRPGSPAAIPGDDTLHAGEPPIRWRRSRAVGGPAGGRLAGGVRLPAAGWHFKTWDPVQHRSPNRPWRRWGTDRLVRLVLRIAREHRAAHPGAPRLLIGDLSRAGGGEFGVRFGRPGHLSHQNGLDVDVYYPRRDGEERAPSGAADIDRRLSQDLVSRFVRAGAQAAFVGPHTDLGGPRRIVRPLRKHDDHVHVRIR